MVPFGTLAIARRRFAAETIDPATYRPYAQTPTTATIYGTIQPPDGDVMETIPDGDRSRARLVIYTASELRTPNQFTKVPADQVQIDGYWWEVESVERWRQVMPHYKAVVARIQEMSPAPVEPP